MIWHFATISLTAISSVVVQARYTFFSHNSVTTLQLPSMTHGVELLNFGRSLTTFWSYRVVFSRITGRLIRHYCLRHFDGDTAICDDPLSTLWLHNGFSYYWFHYTTFTWRPPIYRKLRRSHIYFQFPSCRFSFFSHIFLSYSLSFSVSSSFAYRHSSLSIGAQPAIMRAVATEPMSACIGAAVGRRYVDH